MKEFLIAIGIIFICVLSALVISNAIDVMRYKKYRKTLPRKVRCLEELGVPRYLIEAELILYIPSFVLIFMKNKTEDIIYNIFKEANK